MHYLNNLFVSEFGGKLCQIMTEQVQMEMVQ